MLPRMKLTSRARPRNIPPDALFAQKPFRTPGNARSDRRKEYRRTFRVDSRKISIAGTHCSACGAVGAGDHSILSSAGCGEFARLHLVSWRWGLFARALGGH